MVDRVIEMKKILVVLLGLFLCIGCSSKKSSLDLKKMEKDLLASKYFSNHEVVSKDTIEKKYSLKLNDSDILMLISKDYDDASVVLVADSKNKSEIDAFVSSYNDQWVKFNYFPEEAELVKKATYKTLDNYIIYIVSSNNDDVLKIMGV